MRRHNIPEETSTGMHNEFRNLIEDVDDNEVPLIHKEETLGRLRERKRVLREEGGNLCMYIRVKGRLYRFIGEPVD